MTLTTPSTASRIFDYPGEDRERAPIRQVDGRLPPLPDGTWYLNGPGCFQRGGQWYRHWLDGDGLVQSIVFDRGSVSFASRFVRTRKYSDEMQAGHPRYRTFGTAFPGDRLNARGTGLESPANVAIVNYAGRLLALGEQGEPWVIDGETLATAGSWSMNGALTPVTPFAAHAKVDPCSGELFNFGVSFARHRPELNVFKFDRDGVQVFRSRTSLHCSSSIHDFALAPSYAVFYVSPYVLDMSAIAAGATVLDALAWNQHLGSRIIVVSRATGAQVCSIPIEGRYSLHTINCAETDGLVVFDVVEMPAPIYDAYAAPGLFARPIEAVPVRFRIDPAPGVITSREELASDCAPEFAVVEAGTCSRECTRFWALGLSNARSDGSKFFD